jgi:hypothetical protein
LARTEETCPNDRRHGRHGIHLGAIRPAPKCGDCAGETELGGIKPPSRSNQRRVQDARARASACGPTGSREIPRAANAWQPIFSALQVLVGALEVILAVTGALEPSDSGYVSRIRSVRRKRNGRVCLHSCKGDQPRLVLISRRSLAAAAPSPGSPFALGEFKPARALAACRVDTARHTAAAMTGAAGGLARSTRDPPHSEKPGKGFLNAWTTKLRQGNRRDSTSEG